MIFFSAIWDEILNFFKIRELLKVVKLNDFSSFLTPLAILNVLRTAVPLLLVIEILRNIFYRTFKKADYKVPLLTYTFNAVIERMVSLSVLLITLGFFQRFKLFSTSFTWYWFLYGYIIFELANFIHHYLAHKVRLLWCLHSTHHFPETMNIAVGYNRFVLERPYIDFIRAAICMLLGVNTEIFFFILLIDAAWGLFLHVGEEILPDGRLGLIHNLVFTPSHHRVHHGKNPLYMDRNFGVFLNIWDRVFHTYQSEKKDLKIEYGITREAKPYSFIDANFGEIRLLMNDIRSAPGVKNKILYILMPPGWSHTGIIKTAKKMRSDYLQKSESEAKNNG
jgi:sterol desaturase/sphingolipid hydroxylase (fatty acid hydroxylase superfamily)